jgi:predicted ATP-dependent serine protease
VPQMERRLAETARLGFKRCLIPETASKPSFQVKGVELLTASTVAQALRLGLIRPQKKSESNEEPQA